MTGRRDGWVYVVGLMGVMYFAIAAYAFKGTQTISFTCAVMLVAGLIHLAFFSGLRFARYGFVAITTFVSWLVMVNMSAIRSNEFLTAPDLRASLRGDLFAVVIPLVLSVSLIRDARNRMFFRYPVTREEVASAWGAWAGNQIVMVALFFAMLGFFTPGLGPLSVVLAAFGRWRAAKFPNEVGRAGLAVFAMWLGAIGCIVTAFFVRNLLRPPD